MRPRFCARRGFNQKAGKKQARLRQLPALGDDDRLARAAGRRTERLDLLDDVHALDYLAEDDVLAVEPGRLDGAEELLLLFWRGRGRAVF